VGTKAETEMSSSIQEKTFSTPIMAGIYLGHSTEPHDVEWFEDAPPLQPRLVGSIEMAQSKVRAHRRRRVPHGQAIRKLLVTP
jgi:hypothetical protein